MTRVTPYLSRRYAVAGLQTRINIDFSNLDVEC